MIQSTRLWFFAVLVIVHSLTPFHAYASTSYIYTGNPFTDSPSGLVGNWITASITFSDPLVTEGFTGDVYEASVSEWSIQVAQMPSSKLDSTDAWHDQWPLWFHFEGGIIAAWQLLAEPVGQHYPEIYTTHNSGYPSINPTADYYLINGVDNYGFNLNQAGSWSVVPIPAALWLFFSALVGLGFVGKGRFSK